MVSHAVFGERLFQCSEAFTKLKAATAQMAKAKAAMDDFTALGDAFKPVPEEERIKDIFLAQNENELDDKIRIHAEKDARYRKVKDELDAAEREMKLCAERASATYDALVKHFAR